MGLEHLEYAIPLIFLAAVVRAYTGFGFAALAIIGLNMLWPPQLSVPLVLLLDLLCGIGLIPGAWKIVDKTTLKQLFCGAVLGAPVGLALLIALPELWIKTGTSLLVLLMCLKIALHNPARQQSLSVVKNTAMGALSAAITAAASVGGPPLVAYLTGSTLTPARQRALLVIFFATSSLISLLLMLGAGVINSAISAPLGALILPALAGIFVGNLLFRHRPPRSFRPLVIPLLSLLALFSLALSFNMFQLTPLQQIGGHLLTRIWC